MVVPSFRHRAGAIEIKNRLIKEREEHKKLEPKEKEIISEEEHQKRIEKLKELGLIK
jgi:hypothetical protein